MKYNFPVINTLQDVLPAIQGREEFRVFDKGDYKVVNYVHSTEETFPELEENNPHAAILRECRGLIFGPDDRIISRPYHKFFNLNERYETRIEHVDLTQHHTILEKLDGSMVRPIPMPNGSFRLGTKAGITDISMQAEVHIVGKNNYRDFIEECLILNQTPIFEWCSPKQRIVLDHKEDQLILTAIRNNMEGTYVSYSYLKELMKQHNIPLVQAYDSHNIHDCVEYAKTQEGTEGFVIRFENGHALKLKTSWYVTLHRTKEMVSWEKNVVELLAKHQIDDLLPLLMEQDLERVKKFQSAFWTGVSLNVDAVYSLLVCAKKHKLSRKDFALNHVSKLQPIIRSIAFKHFDDEEITRENVENTLLNSVIRATVSANKCAESRVLWGNAVYKETGE